MRPESRARERAFLFAYASEMGGNPSSDIIDEMGKEERDVVLNFSNLLFEGIKTNKEAIDEKITAYLKNWTIERLRSVDRVILRLAIYEMLYFQKTPIKVIFDEYIELAKRYGDTDSGNFVNAVLAAIYKDNG